MMINVLTLLAGSIIGYVFCNMHMLTHIKRIADTTKDGRKLLVDTQKKIVKFGKIN